MQIVTIWCVAGFSIRLLADRPDLVHAVAQIRWQEWGDPPEPNYLSWWQETTCREAGRRELPVTFVAVGEHGDAIGAVGPGVFDIAERQDRSPWVLGMVVRSDRWRAGVGAALLGRVQTWATPRGFPQLRAATGHAEGFYRRCGWVGDRDAAAGFQAADDRVDQAASPRLPGRLADHIDCNLYRKQLAPRGP